MWKEANFITLLFICFLRGAQTRCSKCDCPAGWKFFNYACYLFSRDFRGWEASKEFCESQNAHLVKVDEYVEHLYLRKVLKAQNYLHYYWIGGRYDENLKKYRWLDGTYVSTIFGWAPNRPRYRECMDYLNNDPIFWEWNDHGDCVNTKGPSICEMNC